MNPEDPDEFMAEEDGGVLMEERPTTVAKFMKECRGMFGVMMKQEGDRLVGYRMETFNYTLQKVVGPAKYEKKFWVEVKRVSELKTTGTSRSQHWKDAGVGLTGGPYEAKYGNNWREMVKRKIGSGQDAVCNVTDLMAHAIEYGNKLFEHTPYFDRQLGHLSRCLKLLVV